MTWITRDPALLMAILFGMGMALTVGGVLAQITQQAVRRRLTSFVGEVESQGGEALVSPTISRTRQLRDWLWTANDALVRMRDRLQTAVVVIGVVCLVGGVLLGVLGLLAAAGVAGVIAGVLGSLRADRERIDLQAGPAVSMLAAGVRAGYSVPQAVALVARESPEPTASYFARVQRRLELGAGLLEAIRELAAATGSRDYDLLATIIGVQHETGGNLALSLDAVAETLRERLELRQLIGALTAQQRLSSLVLTLLPFAVFAAMLVANRPLVEPLISTTAGRALLLGAMGLVGCGWMMFRSLGRIAE